MTLLRTLSTHLVERFGRERTQMLIALSWGVWLLLPWPGGAGGPGPSPGLVAVFGLAHAAVPGMEGEDLWGGLMLVAGLATLWGMVRGQRASRALAALLLGGLWVLMAGCFLSVNPRGPGWLTYAWLGWSALARAARNTFPAAPAADDDGGAPLNGEEDQP